MKKVYTIYMARNKVNGKAYIGFDSDWPARKSAHLKTVREDCPKFHRAIKKYGTDAFEWSILFQGWDRDYVHREVERILIQEYQTQDRDTGYNISPGGDGNSDFLKEKIRIEGHWLKGRPRKGNYASTTDYLKSSATVTNGIIEKRIPLDDLDKYIADGFRRGRLDPSKSINTKHLKRIS
jgi:predicted GIY-YIG superfamily endonuclease